MQTSCTHQGLLLPPLEDVFRLPQFDSDRPIPLSHFQSNLLRGGFYGPSWNSLHSLTKVICRKTPWESGKTCTSNLPCIETQRWVCVTTSDNGNWGFIWGGADNWNCLNKEFPDSTFARLKFIYRFTIPTFWPRVRLAVFKVYKLLLLLLLFFFFFFFFFFWVLVPSSRLTVRKLIHTQTWIHA